MNLTDALFVENLQKAQSYILKHAKLTESTIQYMNDFVKKLSKDKRAKKEVMRLYTKANIVNNPKFSNVVKWEIENKRRSLACKYVFIRLLLRNLIRDVQITYVDRVRLSGVMSKLPRNSLAVRVRNRDAITGYPRSYVRKLGLSRHSINEMQSEGYIPGLYMAMW